MSRRTFRTFRMFRSMLALASAALCISGAAYAAKPAGKPAATSAAKPAVRTETAVFAMGCFWCGETQFEQQPGVLSVVSGYAGGAEKNPTYEEVSAGSTGHYESIQVTFDPTKTSYEKLIDLFWHGIDPTQGDGQFCDRGKQYRSVVFVADGGAQALTFEPRPVTVLSQGGDRVAVEGVKAGERVAVRGVSGLKAMWTGVGKD